MSAPRYVEGVGHIDIDISVLEIGYLMPVLWPKAESGDRIARGLYLKLRAAAIACGVVWYYGDPFDVEAELRRRSDVAKRAKPGGEP